MNLTAQREAHARLAECDEWLEWPPAGGASELLRQYPPELLLDEATPKPSTVPKVRVDEPDSELPRRDRYD